MSQSTTQTGHDTSQCGLQCPWSVTPSTGDQTSSVLECHALVCLMGKAEKQVPILT